MNNRVNIIIRGAVQGVGFRPFIYNLAKELKLKGFVLNNSNGVVIQVEGGYNKLSKFLFRVEKEKPPLSIITSFEHSFLDPFGYKDFSIRRSEQNFASNTLIMPDISICKNCLREMWNPKDRRYRYPFINCTNCGPRFSIIESLPYDRSNTSMKHFTMCEKCRGEYENPGDRRFHAQPIACYDCGPKLSLWDEKGRELYREEAALQHVVKKIRDGRIVAIKGLGGFQLICDATNDNVVKTLRKRKNRKEKPFALMMNSIGSVERLCQVSKAERRILLSAESPIVLLRNRAGKSKVKISSSVAPHNPCLGIMLPYTPLHHLLMKELKTAIIATSGNLSEEPICIDEQEALERLDGLADYFLVHNRPIVRQADDSIVRVVINREMLIRRARGYAPLPLLITRETNDQNILAVGGHLKNTIALKKGNQIFVSQHIGDLSTDESNKAFKNVINDFHKLYNVKTDLVLCDLHPEYLSTQYAYELNKQTHKVQHHYAHIAACRLENQVCGDALGVSWDGTGYGEDGTIWGGEFFLSSDAHHKHIAQFRKFRLPGGEAAIKEPRRSLAGLLYEINTFDEKILKKSFIPREIKVINSMLAENYNSPQTSSAGRLFDAISTLIELCDVSEFEGHAAMLLEFAADPAERKSYNYNLIDGDKLTIDWESMIIEIIKDKKKKVNASVISAKFHNTLTVIIDKISDHFNLKKVILSGGCFQNVFLLEKTIKFLARKDKKVYWHQRIPTNDGGISVGQIAAYLIENSHKVFNKNKNFQSKTRNI